MQRKAVIPSEAEESLFDLEVYSLSAGRNILILPVTP